MDKSKLVLARISDKLKQYQKYGETVWTAFLDPAEQMEAESVLRHVPHSFWGGYEGAERKIAIIGEELSAGDGGKWTSKGDGGFWIGEEAIHFPPSPVDGQRDGQRNTLPLQMQAIQVVRVTANVVLSHRSVLGSILGLGLSREKVGDLIVQENCCDVILQRELAEFVVNNLKYVGREKVSCRVVELSELLVPEKEGKEIFTTVASLRLDAVVSSALGVSREKASNLIEAERVNLNYKLATSGKKAVCEGDLISVRGYGRVEIAEVVGESKSGRVKIRIHKL